MKSPEIETQYEYEPAHQPQEEGVEIPYERIAPDTLHGLISEFVSREWEEIGDGSFTLDAKIEQVHRQLQEKKAKVVFDLSSETANIVVCDGVTYGKGKSHV
jgi:uncharacterized protein